MFKIGLKFFIDALIFFVKKLGEILLIIADKRTYLFLIGVSMLLLGMYYLAINLL